MSCRKFSAPRHGSLGYLPRKRAKSVKQSIKAFEKDNPADPIHLTAFYAYKAGMSHIVRNKVVHAKKSSVKEVLEAITVLEAPPMIVFGIIGYVNTVKGVKMNRVVLSSHINESVVRRIYRKLYHSNKNVFTFIKKRSENKLFEEDIKALKESDSIRVICHTQVEKIKSLRTKKAHISEIQVNGGTIEDKVEWSVNMLEKEVKISDVFSEHELLDTIGVTKGKGFQGVTKRFGTRILPRKTNKGRRKVACIGAWHPANVLYTVPRAGQLGFHKRTEYNKMVYMIGNGKDEIKTEFDLTPKSITPMGGFPKYGIINNDFIMLKGCIVGPSKRVVALRKNLTGKKTTEEVKIKFIDTSSKIGAGRFQTSEEKRAFFGIDKKTVLEGTD